MSLMALTLILAVTESGTPCPDPSTFSAEKKKIIGQVLRLEIPSVYELPEPFSHDTDVLIAWLHRHSDEYWRSGFESPYPVAWRLPETRCAQEALAPYLEMLAAKCNRSQCEDLNGLVFRPYLRELMQAQSPDAGQAVTAVTPQQRLATMQAYFPGSSFGVVSGRFLAVSSVDAGVVRIAAGTIDDTRLTVFRDDVSTNRAADILRERDVVSVPIIDNGGDLPTTFGSVAAHSREWLAQSELMPNAASVACSDGSMRPLGPFVGFRAMWQDFPEGWLRAHVYRLPCEAKWVIPGGVGAPVKWREFLIKRLQRPPGDFDFDVDGPFVKGIRAKRFGSVTYAEHLKNNSDQLPIYREYCTIETKVNGAPISTRIESSYGCHLEYAADFNDDGLSDFIVHTGSESCEFNVLYASSPEGWHPAGQQGSCE